MLECEMIQDTRGKVLIMRQRMTQPKVDIENYANNRRQPLEFEVGDRVFLKISPMRGVMRFEKKGKLSHRFIRPFEVTLKVGRLAYRVALPSDLPRMHDCNICLLSHELTKLFAI